MTIQTKFKPDQTVYLTKPQLLAYTVVSIDINITSVGQQILYTLTRNTSTKTPSGGNKSKVSEETLLANPPSKISRLNIYDLLFENKYQEEIDNDQTQDKASHIAAQYAVINTNHYYNNQELL